MSNDELKLKYKRYKALRQDAMDRGMTDLAIVYGWTAIRLGEEVMTSIVVEIGCAARTLSETVTRPNA